MKWTLACLVVVVSSHCIWTVCASVDGPEEYRARLLGPLRAANIALDEASLIRALDSDSELIAARAALALPELHPRTEAMLVALTRSTGDQRETVALSAIASLSRLEDKGWVRGAVARLPMFADPAVRLQVAGYLAAAGEPAGYSLVLGFVRDERYSLLALESIGRFDGLVAADGRRLDVVSDLASLLGQGAGANRSGIERVMAEITQTRKLP